MAFASQQIIDIFNKVKPPYNINAVSQQIALEALDNVSQINDWIKIIVSQREIISKELVSFSFVKKVYPSDANFILAKVNDAQNLYNYLVTEKIVVRDRSKVTLCEGCLRITIGTEEENKKLLQAFKNYTA